MIVIISAIFPLNVVLGHATMSKLMAAILNGLILSIIILFVPTISKKLELNIKHEKANLVYFFAADLVVIWVLKRFAETSGLGISSILFVIILAALTAILQFKILKYGSKLLKVNKSP